MSQKTRQLTIRGLDREMSARIHELAEREGISLNKAVLKLLKRAVGLAEGSESKRIGNRLDRFIGTWTEEEAAELLTSIQDCERVDPDLWR